MRSVNPSVPAVFGQRPGGTCNFPASRRCSTYPTWRRPGQALENTCRGARVGHSAAACSGSADLIEMAGPPLSGISPGTASMSWSESSSRIGSTTAAQ